MKKIGLLLSLLTLGVMLMGCSPKQESAFSPSDSCVYVAQDGSVSSALVQEYEGVSVDAKDLRQYLEAAVIRFNQANGAEASAQNKQGADRLPAALQSVSVENGRMSAIFEYASVDTMVQFRLTDDNEDDSSTISAVEVKTLTDADTAGWLETADFVGSDGQAASTDQIKSDMECTVASLTGGGNVMFSGQVLYMTEGAEKKDEYTVTLPEDSSAFVVFK